MIRVENLRNNVMTRPEIGISLNANERPVESAHNIKMTNLRYTLNKLLNPIQKMVLGYIVIIDYLFISFSAILNQRTNQKMPFKLSFYDNESVILETDQYFAGCPVCLEEMESTETETAKNHRTKRYI